jgi:hypothetical protein
MVTILQEVKTFWTCLHRIPTKFEQNHKLNPRSYLILRKYWTKHAYIPTHPYNLQEQDISNVVGLKPTMASLSSGNNDVTL